MSFERIFTKARKSYEPRESAFEVLRNKDKSITIRRDNSDGTFTPEVTFAVGDTAEYDSYNFSYLGEIVSISKKSVTIVEGYGTKKHRLDLASFAIRNYDFDLDKSIKRNQEVSYSI